MSAGIVVGAPAGAVVVGGAIDVVLVVVVTGFVVVVVTGFVVVVVTGVVVSGVVVVVVTSVVVTGGVVTGGVVTGVVVAVETCVVVVVVTGIGGENARLRGSGGVLIANVVEVLTELRDVEVTPAKIVVASLVPKKICCTLGGGSVVGRTVGAGACVVVGACVDVVACDVVEICELRIAVVVEVTVVELTAVEVTRNRYVVGVTSGRLDGNNRVVGTEVATLVLVEPRTLIGADRTGPLISATVVGTGVLSTDDGATSSTTVLGTVKVGTGTACGASVGKARTVDVDVSVP